MEERLNKLEKEILLLQKTLYKMEVSLDAIAEKISSAVAVKEEVIILEQQYKSIDKRVIKCEGKREEMEKKVNAIENKLSLYAGAITIIAIVVPYIIKIII